MGVSGWETQFFFLLYLSSLGLVVGVNHTSRKVAWFTYISLLLSVRVVYVCVMRVFCVFL